jgi:nucleotide-binding universal stress UspA family protein
MYKTILLPIDLDDEASTAKLLPVAREIALNAKAELCVMTVVPESLSLTGKDGSLEAAQRRLRELAASSLRDLKQRHVIAYGSAEQEILRVAKECGAELIIIGSHKPSARDLLLGSTATQVVRRAPCSVLVVR